MPESVAEHRRAAVINTLRSSQLFAGIPPEDIAAVADITVLKAVGRGEYLFREGDPSIGLYIVQTGAVNIHRMNAAGKEQIIHVFRAGESFAEGALATVKGYPADARAVEASQLLLVKKEPLLALIRRKPELSLRMLASMSSHLRVLVGQLEDLTLRDVETRLANWLLKRCPKPVTAKPVTIELSMTKRLLAAELGTVGETFSRTLAKFRELGLVNVRQRTLTILSPVKLEALLRSNLGE